MKSRKRLGRRTQTPSGTWLRITTLLATQGKAIAEFKRLAQQVSELLRIIARDRISSADSSYRNAQALERNWLEVEEAAGGGARGRGRKRDTLGSSRCPRKRTE